MGLWVDWCSDSARFCWVVCSRGPTGSLGGSASCPSRPPWTSVLAAIALLMVLAKAQLARGAHEVPERSRLELARCSHGAGKDTAGKGGARGPRTFTSGAGTLLPLFHSTGQRASFGEVQSQGQDTMLHPGHAFSPHGGADRVASMIPSVKRSCLPSQMLLLPGEPLTETAQE